MKFNVQSKALYSAVSAVSKVINGKNSMQILNTFLLSLRGDNLTITASDIENTLSSIVPITDSEGDGDMCIDARLLSDVLKSLPDVALCIDINDETKAAKLTFNGDRGNYDFVAIDGIEFPKTQIETQDDAQTFTIAAGDLLSGLESTVFAVGTDTIRPQMMGVYIDAKPDSLTFVATDTRKLVKCRKQNVHPDITVSCILPTKPAQVLKSIISASDGDFNISIDNSRMLITNGIIKFSCLLLKGMYPDYDKVIPRNNPFSLTVDRELFLSALRRTAIFGDQAQNLAKLRITPTEITIKTFDSNYCTSAIETVPCDFNHNEIVIGFSSQYMIEIFSTITSEEVTVTLSDPSRPGVFTPATPIDGTDIVMLLMPMNVTEF